MEDTMNTFDLSQTIRKQAEKRKTIDLALLQNYVVSMANKINDQASNSTLNNHGYDWQDGQYHIRGNPSGIALANTIMEGFMFMLDCYGGYNSRMWRAFTDCPKWLEIVNRLHAIDEKDNSSHYWKLLSRLEYGHNKECKAYYSKGNIDPTEKELVRARRIHDHYVYTLGL
jgi:hypothetical protein